MTKEGGLEAYMLPLETTGDPIDRPAGSEASIRMLISTIDNIVRYGIRSPLDMSDRYFQLTRDLVSLYAQYYEIKYVFDDAMYPDFDTSQLPDIRRHVSQNFKEFGFYKTHANILNIDNVDDTTLGDAVDDLTDIIIDLIEIKWRMENNSVADGLWFFEHSFRTHVHSHLLGILNYVRAMKP